MGRGEVRAYIGKGHYPPPSKGEVFAWCMYDFANSSFTTLIVTVAYSVYFVQVVARGYPGERLWGWGYSTSMIAIALISPVLGAVADYSGKKRHFLAFFTALCILPTGLLFFVKEGDIWWGVILFAVANIGFNGGITFYNAFLIEISDKTNIGRVSGYGWALGYIGGLVCLGLAYPFLKGGFSEENLLSYRLSFVLTALFFLLACLPTFAILKERAVPYFLEGRGTYWAIGFKRIKETFYEIRRFKELLRYLFAYLIYTDGINTVIVFAAIFASKVLNFTPQEIIVYFLVTQISAALGAYFFGFITDWIGAKRSVSLTLLVWIAISFGAYIVQTKFQFYILGLGAGIVLGSNQSASRALLGLFTPHGKSAEFFGFFSLTGKFASTLGPLIYGEITARMGQRMAVISIGLFFLIGLAALQMVNEREGIEAAENFERLEGEEKGGDI